jgi:hypothetical protein
MSERSLFMRQTAFLLPVLLGASLLQAADPQLLSLVPPNSKVIAGVNLDQARSSPLGQFLTSMLPTDQGFQQFVAATGFDPRRDLHEILVAATGPEKTAGHLILARGTFDVNRMLALVPQDNPLIRQTYNGTLIFSHSKDEMSFAFPDANTAVAGDLASVKASIDRRGQSAGIDPLLAARIAVLSSTLDAWAISTLPFSSLPHPAAGPNSKNIMSSELLAKIQQTSGGIKFGDQVQFVGEAVTGDPKDATALGDVIKFLATMAQSQAPAEAAPAVALMQNLHVVADGATLHMDLAIPESQIEALVTAHKAPAKPAI